MKRFCMVLILAAICCTSIFAFGIGLQAGGTVNGSGFSGAGAITFKLDSAPWVFAVNGGYGWFGITADQWMVNKAIASPLNYFIGWGIGGGLTIGDYNSVNIAARLPIGLNMFLANDFIEPYLQIAPSFGVSFVFSSGIGFYWSIPINLGLRFWIK